MSVVMAFATTVYRRWTGDAKTSDGAPQATDRCDARFDVACEPRGDFICGERTAQQEPLNLVAAELAQTLQRCFVLDAFGDDGEAQLVRELDGRPNDERIARVAHDHRVARVSCQVHDERLVDLELIHREPPQVGERRIAGAVIIDRKPAAERMQPTQVVDGIAGVIKDRAFRDFERDPMRGAAVRLQQRSEALGQLEVHQVACRDVDRHVHRQPVAAPRRALRDCPQHHPLRDSAYIAGLLGEGNELGGWH